jgi:hypothetical protein
MPFGKCSVPVSMTALSRKCNATGRKQRQKRRKKWKTKEKVVCVELPQLAETAPLVPPLARFGKSVRSASKQRAIDRKVREQGRLSCAVGCQASNRLSHGRPQLSWKELLEGADPDRDRLAPRSRGSSRRPLMFSRERGTTTRRALIWGQQLLNQVS